MADLDEAFDILKFQHKPFSNIDYFFTQRTVMEEMEYIDKNMNRQFKKQKVTYNFLALNIPLKLANLAQMSFINNEQYNSDNILSENLPNENSISHDPASIDTRISKQINIESDINPIGFDIEIFGDEGYYYKGTIVSHTGIIPNFMIPIHGDKKIFVNINYKFINNNKHIYKKYISFIEVPKRFQNN